MRRLLVALLLILLSPLALCATEKRFGYCQTQNLGLRVTGCTVTVYLTGTTTLANPIYSDNLNTPKANPFVADASSGFWFFYADNGRYDVVFSGGAPTISPAYTLSDLLFLDLASGGPLIASSFSSTSANVATTGVLRLASGDIIAWRNAANSANVGLDTLNAASGSVPVDTIATIGSAGIWSNFLAASTGNSVAITGSVRLDSGGAVAWRNNAGTDDIRLIKLTAPSGSGVPTDTVAVANGSLGSILGFWANPLFANTTSAPSTGQIRLSSADAIAWRNAANTADLIMNLSGADQLQLNGFLGVKGNYFQTGSSGSPALSGDIRMPNGSAIKARNFANTADLSLISLDSLNFVDIGDSITFPFIPGGSLTGGGFGVDFSIASGSGTGNGANLNLGAANAGIIGPTFGGNINLLPGNSSSGARNGQVIVSPLHYFFPSSYTFAQLGTPTNGNGALVYCSDCNIATDPCTGGGSGAMASRLNGRWRCQ